MLRGSHKLGRLDHVREDGQTNAEREHLEAALKRFELVYVEMEPGDALAFDGNLLHRSDANRTDTYRWGYISSYNAVENAPYKKVREYGNYQPLRKAPAGSFQQRRSDETRARRAAAKRDILRRAGRAYAADRKKHDGDWRRRGAPRQEGEMAVTVESGAGARRRRLGR